MKLMNLNESAGKNNRFRGRSYITSLFEKLGLGVGPKTAYEVIGRPSFNGTRWTTDTHDVTHERPLARCVSILMKHFNSNYSEVYCTTNQWNEKSAALNFCDFLFLERTIEL